MGFICGDFRPEKRKGRRHSTCGLEKSTLFCGSDRRAGEVILPSPRPPVFPRNLHRDDL